MTEVLETRAIDEFEALSDDELEDIAAKASHILERRVTERRKNAVDEIRRLARENGLSVRVKQPSRKRGRPRKAAPQASEKKESA